MADKQICCLYDLSDALKSIVEEFGHRIESQWSVKGLPKGHVWHFRGQTKREFPLIPSLGRMKLGNPFAVVEEQLMSEFKREYLSSGHRHPKDTCKARGCEEFDWDWMFAAIGQHYGLPTRLLDWTINAAKALFFAVAASCENELKCDGILYGFYDPSAISLRSGVKYCDNSIRNARVFNPTSHELIDVRVQAQDGRFTWQPDPTTDFVAQVELRQDERQILEKWIIPHGAKQNVRKELEQIRISRASLFPGIEGVCNHVTENVLGLRK